MGDLCRRAAGGHNYLGIIKELISKSEFLSIDLGTCFQWNLLNKPDLPQRPLVGHHLSTSPPECRLVIVSCSVVIFLVLKMSQSESEEEYPETEAQEEEEDDEGSQEEHDEHSQEDDEEEDEPESPPEVAAVMPTEKAHFKEKISDIVIAPHAAAASSAAQKKPGHPTTADMVRLALTSLHERNGSSLIAIKKYIAANYTVDLLRLTPFIRKYIKAAVEAGVLIQTKGTGLTGSFKLSGKVAKKKSKVKKVKKIKATEGEEGGAESKKVKKKVDKEKVKGEKVKASRGQLNGTLPLDGTVALLGHLTGCWALFNQSSDLLFGIRKTLQLTITS